MLRKTKIQTLVIAVVALLAVGPPGAAQRNPETEAGSSSIDRLLADGLTRGEMMSLYESLAAGGSEPSACVPGEELFDDVPASHPFCPWVEELARRGITSGCDADNFCPGDSVSRAQFATFLVTAVEGAPEPVAVYDDIVNTVFLDLVGAGPGAMVPGNALVEYGNVLDPDTGAEIGEIASRLHFLEVRDAEASDFDFYLDCTITLADGAVEFGGAGSSAGILDGSGEPLAIRGGTGVYEGAEGTASVVFDVDEGRHLISLDFSG